MRIRTVTTAALLLLVLSLPGCTNTQPAYYGAYPSDHDFGPDNGYQPYASAPYDPYGAYYQNFAPATPYYYEPPESHRNCDDRPCIAYRRDAAEPLLPQLIAPPLPAAPLNPPSTISRAAHPAPPATGAHPQPANVD